MVSDYDDTIKISNTNNTVGSVGRAFSTELFYGAPEFFQMLESEHVQWWILSGAPKIMAAAMRTTLSKHSLHPSAIVLRTFPGGPEVQEHKTAVLRDYLTRNPGEQIVCFGDDQQKDPEAYLQIAREFPGRVLAIYIHRVQNRWVEARSGDAIDFFWTWQEVAWKEFTRGRLNAQALVAYEAVWSRASIRRADVFPKFAVCPVQKSEFGVAPDAWLADRWTGFADRWARACAK